MKTFIIEDNAAELAKVQGFLTLRCPAVQIVGTAGEMQEAYQGIMRARPDLLISDIRITGGRCYELLNQLKAHNRLQGMRIIFMTGFREFGIARDGYEFAPVAFLEKPCTALELQEAVAKVARQAHCPQATDQLELLLELVSHRSPDMRRLTVSLVGGSLRMLEIRDIVYLQSDGSVTRFYMRNCPGVGQFLASNKPLIYYRTLLKQLPCFFSIGSTELINLDHLDQYDHGERLLRFGASVPHFYASRAGARAIREYLSEHPLSQ